VRPHHSTRRALRDGLRSRRPGLRFTSSSAAPDNLGSSVSASNIVDFKYDFDLGAANNGNVATWSATGQQSFSRSYTYDELNRLKTMA
jgi:hypothetical protein